MPSESGTNIGGAAGWLVIGEVLAGAGAGCSGCVPRAWLRIW